MAEQGVSVWNSGLTKAQIKDIEKIQKVALIIILGSDYGDYEGACNYFGIAKLSLRRAELCTNFAVKLYLSPRCDQFFTRLNHGLTRNVPLVKENTCRTTRCYNAPHNYLSRLVNQNVEKIAKYIAK